ncbi:hypothetical protein BHE74_00054567, partial [Ensete ventricosum]
FEHYITEEYTEELAVAHIRRLLDIVACTTTFGAAPPRHAGGTAALSSGSIGKGDTKPSDTAKAAETISEAPKTEATAGSPNTKAGSKKPDSPTSAVAGAASYKDEPLYPPPKLAQFYDFFSFSHLTPPLQYVRRSSRPFVEDKRDDEFFQIDAYKSLMKAFLEHNKFGNLPYGFRANTWVVPPIAADSPSVFPPLPTEDETWGGNGGGQGRDGKHDQRPWANEFTILAAMPCKTPEERQIRDRKAFLLHSLFVDVAVVKAVEAIQHLDTATLSVVVIRHCGYTVVVKVPVEAGLELTLLSTFSLRALLHKSTSSCGAQKSQCADLEDLQSFRSLVREVLADSLQRLQEEATEQRMSIRWELGACWVQHLQNQSSGKTESKKTEDSKVETTVKGLGKQFGQLKQIKKKLDDKGWKTDSAKENSCVGMDVDGASPREDKEMALQKLLPEAAYLRLKESETGLHVKVELSDKLPHVQSLCIHEMIVRAYKHILQAIIAAVGDITDMAGTIASWFVISYHTDIPNFVQYGMKNVVFFSSAAFGEDVEGHRRLWPSVKNVVKKKPSHCLSFTSWIGIVEGGRRWIGTLRCSPDSPSSSSAFSSSFSLRASSLAASRS